MWADSGEYREILGRVAGSGNAQLIEVVEILAYELAPEGQSIDPYVIVFDQDRQVLRTATVAGVRSARWDGFRSTDKGVDQPRSFEDRQPLFFELWDDNTFSDTFVGGFVAYPSGRDAVTKPSGDRVAEYTIKILWNWKEPRAVARTGFARVTVRFLDRQTPPSGDASRKSGP